jgi:peptide/nickel transport system substrate-binding protein
MHLRTSPQAGLSGWQADYPAASIFFALVSCSTLGDRSLNASRFCSREFQTKVNRAIALQARDQAAAAKLWEEVDRDNTSLAAVVPTHTPRDIDLVSKRVGNYQHHPLYGVMVDQLWVR